jgi:starch synthase
MRVVHVSSEAAPFAQSGGLADVLGGLPPALAQAGLDVAVLMPLYRGVDAKVAAAGATLDSGAPMQIQLGPHTFPAELRRARVGDVAYAFVDCPMLFDRAGGLYGPTGSSEFHDNHLRFAALGKVAVEHGASLVGGPMHVLHVHDWQGSAAAVYGHIAGIDAAIVTTIHNLAYRGIFPKHVMTELGWPWSLFNVANLEFYDQVSFLKGGIAAADAVTTVSPSYAQEILTPQFGEALDGFLQHDIGSVVGIVNGIDTQSWDPATDAALPAHYSATSLEGKAQCRTALAAELGITLRDDQPLIAVIARMTGQKGLDLVKEVVPHLHRLDAKLVVLGSGEPDLEATFTWLADAFSNNIFVRIGFDIALSRRIYAGSDLFLMPSRFEPCGLGQLYAMRYGSIPVVHAVGGLRDTVIDPGDAELARGNGTGIQFHAPTAAALLGGVERAVKLFRDPRAITAVRRAAMARDSSWTASAQQYVELYQALR